MKPLTVKNEVGETIDIKFDADGVIQIRHSDIDSKKWAVLHEYSKRLREPKLKAAMEAKFKIDAVQAGELMNCLGGYVVLKGDMKIINAEEVALIHQAVRQAGGIVPNWSAQS